MQVLSGPWISQKRLKRKSVAFTQAKAWNLIGLECLLGMILNTIPLNKSCTHVSTITMTRVEKTA